MNREQNPKEFLKSGRQTEITEKIDILVSPIEESDKIEVMFSILKAIHKNLKPNYAPEIKNKLIRTRAVDEILESGFVTGCTDYALVAAALFRASNIPAVYVETFRRKWLEGNEKFIEGHIFVEIYLNNRWLIVDPENACVKGWHDRFIVYKRGLDS